MQDGVLEGARPLLASRRVWPPRIRRAFGLPTGLRRRARCSTDCDVAAAANARSIGLVEHRDVRLDPAVIHQPVQHLGGGGPARRYDRKVSALRLRNRKFADSLLEGDGFELLVPRCERRGFPGHCGHRGWLQHRRGDVAKSRRSRLRRVKRGSTRQGFADSPQEGNGFQLSVPRRERNETGSRTETVTEAIKVRLKAVVYLPGTDGSNPFPSSGKSANHRYLSG